MEFGGGAPVRFPAFHLTLKALKACWSMVSGVATGRVECHPSLHHLNNYKRFYTIAHNSTQFYTTYDTTQSTWNNDDPARLGEASPYFIRLDIVR